MSKQRVLFLCTGNSARTLQEQEMVKCEIESTDRQIDNLVYELSPKGDDIWIDGG